MAHRTTLLFDSETRQAAKKLALRYDCSTSEAVRRAVVSHHDHVFGVSDEARRHRRQTLDKLIELFDGHDADEEIQRLKEQDEGF